MALRVEVEVSEMRPLRLLPLFTDSIFLLLALYFLYLYTRSLSIFSGIQIYFLWIFQLSVLILLVIRKPSIARSSSIFDYVYTFAAFGSAMFFRPVPGVGSSITAELLEVGGAVVLWGGILSLNRSFGIAPENRGVKTSGMYRVVRHPMYLGYILMYAGFVLGNFSFPNILILSATVSFLVLRLEAEERILRGDATYQVYVAKTRWKLIPLIF